MKILTKLLILIFVLCMMASAEENAIQFVESYAGPHPNEFHSLLDSTKSIVPAALAYITNLWGLPNMLHSPLLVRIVDTVPDMPGQPVAAYVRTVRAGEEVRQVLVVDLSHHLLYPDEDLQVILYHEMAHAVLQDNVTSAVAVGIPQWFNEGLAQSVTREGSERTQNDFIRYGHTDSPAVVCDLNGNVDVFYHGEYNFGCYTSFYLAVQRLIALGGKETVRQIIMGLHNGIPLPLLIRQVTQMDWPTFQANVAQYTRDVFSGTAPIPGEPR